MQKFLGFVTGFHCTRLTGSEGIILVPRGQILRLHTLALDLGTTAQITKAEARRQERLLERQKQAASLLMMESQKQMARSLDLVSRSRKLTRQLNN
jgi:hypothetical protein